MVSTRLFNKRNGFSKVIQIKEMVSARIIIMDSYVKDKIDTKQKSQKRKVP
uniref:Uncharacterized protein n=1 Tax=Arundo donax TaxID=35708 RepID=A0A0A9BF87_ARUDO